LQDDDLSVIIGGAVVGDDCRKSRGLVPSVTVTPPGNVTTKSGLLSVMFAFPPL